MDRSTPKPSAAYGHACSNCVKAKCKCIPRESDGCERCHRLNKDCQPATFVRTRGAPKSVRKSQLEDKLDSLVNLLQAQHATPSLAPSPSAQMAQSNQVPLPSSSKYLTSIHGITNPFPSDQSPQQVFSIFRTRHLEWFPFLYVPTDASVEVFVNERPFTYRAIQVICEKSRMRQNELGTAVREDLILRVVVGGERSIDLLLCLLVCMTWQVYFTHSPKGGMGMLLNIAKHVIADLGYNRPTGLVLACPKACPKPSVIVGQRPGQRESHNDEERRALVACFALSAMTALAIKTEPIRWSSLIAKACDRLAQNVDIKGHTILVAIARISRVSVDAYNTIQQIHDEPASAPYAVHQIRGLHTMLDLAKSNLTQEQLQNEMVLCYLHSTEIQIYEPVLYGLSSPTPPATVDYQRIDYLTACLRACKASLDNYLVMPTISINMVTVLAFSNACQILYTLSMVEYLGWDRQAARRTADVLWYFDQVRIKFGGASRLCQEETGSEDNIFALGHEGLNFLSAKWKESLDSMTGFGMDFTGLLGGGGDMWMANADMWFSNVFEETQF